MVVLRFLFFLFLRRPGREEGSTLYRYSTWYQVPGTRVEVYLRKLLVFSHTEKFQPLVKLLGYGY